MSKKHPPVLFYVVIALVGVVVIALALPQINLPVIITPSQSVTPTITATSTSTPTPTRTATPTEVPLEQLAQSLKVTVVYEENVVELSEQVIRWELQAIGAVQAFLCEEDDCNFVPVTLVIGDASSNMQCQSDKLGDVYYIYDNPTFCSNGPLRDRALFSTAHEAAHIYVQWAKLDQRRYMDPLQEDWVEGSAEWVSRQALFNAKLMPSMGYGPVDFDIDLMIATHIDQSPLDGAQRVRFGYNLMDYVATKYGVDSLIEVFTLVGRGQTRTAAIKQALGISETELYSGFLDTLP